MIIVCQNCSARFQVDDQRPSARPNTVCSECQKKPASASPAVENSALSVGGSPATDKRRSVATQSKSSSEVTEKQPSMSETERFVQMLASMLGQAAVNGSGPAERPPWKQRKALVCATDEQRERISLLLSQGGYQVLMAGDTRQAVEHMRENKLDVVLLDPQFDALEQGSAFVVREVNVLRPAQRRRLFFVLLSPTLRTMDAHGAFLNNVNAIVNLKELDDLVQILEHAVRGFNDLYRDFNQALKLAAI